MIDSNETFRWEQLAKRQKIYIVAIAIMGLVIVYGLYHDRQMRREVQIYEQAAITAKREAQAALEGYVKLAKETVEKEKQLLEIEAKRDVKRKEQYEAEIRRKDAGLDYYRTLREQRGDNPSDEQLCAEARALGFAHC